VIDPTVPPGVKVDLKLTQVPWDQAFDVVLKTSQLAYEVDGTVVRVVSASAMQREYEERQKYLAARADADAVESVKARLFTLNYAKGADLEKVLRSSALSKHGDTRFDERTNTLIVLDVPDRLEAAAAMIATLDQPQPQVEIEARIVETDLNSARSLGVQWGFNGRALPELGNTTGLGFPNSGTVGGRTTATQQPNDARAGDLSKTGTAVNLPVIGATSAVGLSLGAVNGAFNLDVALSALEQSGKLRILSTPRVTTQNNQEAAVTQGFEVPFQIVSNNTVTIQFRDAALKLTVTPQITNANTVIMRIALENGFPDFTRAVNGNPSIRTQRASTQVQVADGVTTVIGGVLATQESQSRDSTPGVSSVPLLKWLFQRRDSSSQSQELLIFITPRVIRGVSGCTNAQLAGQSSAYVVIDQVVGASGAKPTEFDGQLASDVLTYVKKTVQGTEVRVPTVFQDEGRATFHLALKDPGSLDAPTVASSTNTVTFTRYHVAYARADGRNTPGVDVPYSFDGGLTVSVVGGNTSIADLVLVRVQAKDEAPLKALVGGGGAIAISTIATVTFYGADQAGRGVNATGNIGIDFADWGDPD
jgi:type IV pilus secretin PilQ/predicted competence protein